MPPSPNLLLELYAKWKSLIAAGKGENFVGLDDGSRIEASAKMPQLVDRPPLKLKGTIQTLVLLVDFPDRPHADQRDASFYEQMLLHGGNGRA